MKVWQPLQLVLLSMSFTILGACGSPGGGDADVVDVDETEEGVFDPMIGTMDKAAGVEDLAEGRKEELDEALAE